MLHEFYEGAESLKTSTDWRLPENRIESFRRVTYQRMVEGDLDHHHTGRVISDMMGLDKDQQALYCLLFGQSYRNHWAMIVLQQFPDLLNVDQQHLQDWHDKNWKRCFYAKDTKWGVRKFPAYVQDIKAKLKGRSPYEYLEELSTGGTTEQNFKKLNAGLRELYGIGRMTAWLAQQTIYEFFDFDIDHWDLQLYDDTWSQYDSMCYLFDRLDLARKQITPNGIVKREPTKDDIKLMESHVHTLMQYCNDKTPFDVDIYNVESCLCEYRKTAYGPRIKEFTFWTTNELIDQYDSLSSAWPEIDWKPYLAGIMSKGKHITDFSLNKEYFRVLHDHGMNLNTHHVFKDEPNAHDILGLQRIRTPGMVKTVEEWNSKFTLAEQEALKLKYYPPKYLRMKEGHLAWGEKNVDFYWKP